MSQHFFKATTNDGIPVEIMAGWDRPLGYYFAVVEVEPEYLFQNEEIESPLYSNMFDIFGSTKHTQNFSYYEKKLAELGITLPPGMIEEIEQDMANNVGNKIVDWSNND